MVASQTLEKDSLNLLKELIACKSLSRDEQGTAKILRHFFEQKNIKVEQIEHNIWVKNRYFKDTLPTILLNSHHDTVRPNVSYTLDPFTPIEKEGKLYGLGSNDAGGALVSLAATFLHFYESENLTFNIIFGASAEEEISGKNGIELLLKHLPVIALGIVGEPTSMQMAIAEKGLMVLDCTAKGKAGHAAREEGINAIYEAIPDIEWFKTFTFPLSSAFLGPIKMSVTQINSGSQHNVVPDECSFVVDVRATEAYTLEETLSIIKQNVKCEVTPRSVRLNPSGISESHPIVVKGKKLGLETYGSPTLSDQALMPFDTIKIGPGDSERSHTADEFIYLSQLSEGIKTYINLLEDLKINNDN